MPEQLLWASISVVSVGCDIAEEPRFPLAVIYPRAVRTEVSTTRNAPKILNETRSFSSVERRGRAGGRFWALGAIFRGIFHRSSFSTPPRTSPDSAGSARRRRRRPATRYCPQRKHFAAGVFRAATQRAGHDAAVLAFGLVQDVDAARIDLDDGPHGLPHRLLLLALMR